MKTEKFTPEQVTTAIQWSKGMITVAARVLHCTPQTVRNYVQRYPAVQEVLEEEREVMLDWAELALCNAIERGEPWAIRLYLTTQGKSRGYTTRAEGTGTDGNTLPGPIIYIPQEDP